MLFLETCSMQCTPVCTKRHNYTLANNSVVPLIKLYSCTTFDQKTEIARGKLVMEAGGCEVCTSWQNAEKYVNRERAAQSCAVLNIRRA